MQASNRSQPRPNKGNVKLSARAAQQVEEAGVNRIGDRLLQLPEVSELTTLSEATLRWLRHRKQGPPMFKLGRRLVTYESDVHAWIAEQAAKEQAVAS